MSARPRKISVRKSMGEPAPAARWKGACPILDKADRL
jgi:hypothetical protein